MKMLHLILVVLTTGGAAIAGAADDNPGCGPETSHGLTIKIETQLRYERDDGATGTIMALGGRELQGTGAINSALVFVALSSDSEGGASTLLYLFDVGSGDLRLICEMGATGETTFAVNSRGTVAFNWLEAIYIVDSAGMARSWHDAGDCNEWKQKLRRVMGCESCYQLRWIDSQTLSFEQWSSDGRVVRTHAVDDK